MDEEGYHFILCGLPGSYGLAKIRRLLSRFAKWDGAFEGSRSEYRCFVCFAFPLDKDDVLPLS